MPRYLMLIHHREDYRDQPIPQPLLAAMGEFVTEKLKTGAIIDTAGLERSNRATTVRVARGKVSVTDGPFAEAKEVVGGYALINAPSKEEAIALATRFVDIHRENWPEFEFACEIRPVEG